MPFRGENAMTGQGIESPAHTFPHSWVSEPYPQEHVALFPPVLRPTSVVNENLIDTDMLHLEAFCLAQFEFSMVPFLTER